MIFSIVMCAFISEKSYVGDHTVAENACFEILRICGKAKPQEMRLFCPKLPDCWGCVVSGNLVSLVPCRAWWATGPLHTLFC